MYTKMIMVYIQKDARLISQIPIKEQSFHLNYQKWMIFLTSLSLAMDPKYPY